MPLAERTLHYETKLELYKYIADRAAGVEGPPEAKWYGLWNLFLNLLAASDKQLLVFPQFDFRVQTANPVGAINKSTRYTDLALLACLGRYDDATEELIGASKKLLIAVEVKPDGAKHDDAEMEVLEQIRHHYWMQDRDNDMDVIGISAVGAEWSWANIRRTSGTSPAGQSENAAIVFMNARTHVATVKALPSMVGVGPDGWMPYVEAGTLASNRFMNILLDIIKLRLF